MAVLGKFLARQDQEIVGLRGRPGSDRRLRGPHGRLGCLGAERFARFGTMLGPCFAIRPRGIKLGIRQAPPAASLSAASTAPATSAALIVIPVAVPALVAPFRRVRAGCGRRRRRRNGFFHGCFRGRFRFDNGLGPFHRNRRKRGPTLLLEDFIFDASYDFVVFVVVFEEIGDIQKGIAIQADIDKCRLHARQNARDSAFMDTSGERIFILPLMENFNYLIVFDHRHACFVAIGRDD